ncbi:hypothetical protein A3Q56_08466, partial [Intoshia linei]
MVERANRTIREKLRILCKEDFSQWDTHLHSIMASLRFSPTYRNNLPPLEIIHNFNSLVDKNKNKTKLDYLKKLLISFRKKYLKNMTTNYNKRVKKNFRYDIDYMPNESVTSKEQYPHRKRSRPSLPILNLLRRYFDICVLLTYKIIQSSGLCENDTHFELKLITKNKREQDEKLLKLKKESTNYSNRKKIRLNDSGCSS